MKTWLMAALCVLAASAQAQTVWRCGPEGRSYSDSPCPQGRAVEVAERSRPAADVQQAERVAQREQALASQLSRERLQREAPSGSGLAGIRDSRSTTAGLTSKAKAAEKRKNRLEGLGT
jgi:hypothetical protein